MAFCPNLSDPQIKEEFEALVKKYGKASAHYIWDARERASRAGKIRTTINQTRAKAWLAERFPGTSVEFYDTAKEVGDGFVHGYVHNAGMHLWTAAESGTEYHEAYHVTFRTMLSNEQREGLYEEARKQFGEPTADEVANILSQFPNISEQEASNLVLEEKMAEEFREYVLTEEESGQGLLGKIAKWFKNLFNWIKAMISDNLSLKQTYSLIQSNNMGKSLAGRGVFRNPQKFQGHDVAYMHRTEFTERDFIEIKDTLYTIFMDTKKSKGKAFNVSEEMGIEGYKGNIPNNALTKLYKKVDGSSVEFEEAEQLFAAETAYIASPTPTNAAAFKQLKKKFGAEPALKNNITARNNYANIYKTWNTTLNPVTGNVEKYGWRDILVEKLRDNGIKITGKDVTEYELQKEEADMEDEEIKVLDGLVEKIYSKSQLEDSPAKRLTGKVKELLSTIKNGKPNKYGVDTYVDKEVVYRELLEIITGKRKFSSMIAALENAAIYKPATVKPILEFIKNLSAPEKAMIYNAFALATTEFVLMKSNETKAGLKVDLFNPNRKGKSETLADAWRRGLIATEDENSRGIYKEVIEAKEEGEDPTITYQAIKSKVLEIQEAFKALEGIMPPRPVNDIPMVEGVTHPLVKAIGDIMWSMGLNVGNNMNIQETYNNVHRIVSNGFYVTDSSGVIRPVKGEGAIKELESKLFSLADGIATFKKVGKSKVGEIVGLKNNSNYIQAKKATALQVAEFFAPILSIAGEGFVNASGSQIHPTNLQSHMQEIVNDIKDDRANMLKQYMQDPFIGAHGNSKYQSILFRMLQNDEYFKEFNVADLDAIKESDKFDDAIAYEDMSAIDSYVARVNAYINGGRADTTRMFLSIQADRDKYSALTAPRLSNIQRKLQSASRKELIKAQIVQDFLRVAEARRVVAAAEKSGDRSLLIDGVHTDAKTGMSMDEDGNYLGRAFDPKFFQFTALDENGKQIVTNEELTKNPDSILGRKFLSSVIDDYVNDKLSSKEEKEDIDRRLDNMVTKLDTYMKNQAVKLKNILSEKSVNDETHLDRIGWAGMQGEAATKIDDILEGFVFEETIMRNEMVKLFRGSRVYSKNLVDFYKRMGHLTSPGSKYALKSDNIGSTPWLNGELYGMMDTFNEATFEDFQANITAEQSERATMAANKMQKSLEASGVPTKQAKIIADSYRPGKVLGRIDSKGGFESSNAQAYISLEMHRGLMQGEGRWVEEEERAYRAYKITGEFVYQPGFAPKGYQAGDAVPIYPIKTYFEKLQLLGNSMTPISEKNSYSVLIKSYTKDFPLLEDLRQRMEAEGDYAGLDPIHVVNFVSGKKLAKRNVYKVTGKPKEFAAVVLNVNDSRGLRKPQSIPEMKENPVVTLNRQIKKNMMANVMDKTNYTYNAGIGGMETSVDGKKLKDLYHAAIEEKLNRDMEAVMDELKITDLEAALGDKKSTPADINKAKLEVLKNIRDIIYQQILDGDLHSNYYRSLDIEIDATGKPRFKVPLDLPIYNKKFESIIMSVMNNRVFKQSVKGYEAVQVAQLGGHATDNELKFYEIAEENGKQRLAHAEIMIREDLARQFGIKPGQSLDEVPEELRRVIGYRIPNQDKASTVILKIKAFLPENYAKSVVVPGQLVKLMGSDFDVDKLFLMFPEVQKDSTSNWGIKKILPDYKSILKNTNKLKDRRTVSDAQLNNIILDTMEAVMSNPAHFTETLSPLDDTTLQEEVDRVRKNLPEFDLNQDWNDISTETDALVRNQAGNKLRGIYANIIAGRNVAQHGIINLHEDYSIKITDSTGKTNNFFEYQSYTKEVIDPETGEVMKYVFSTDKSGSLFLSAAVDAGKDPIQLELNDSTISAPIRALFMAYHTDYDTATCTNLLNQPYVRMLTDIITKKYNGNLSQMHNAKKIVIAAIKDEMEKRNAESGDTSPVAIFPSVETAPMLESELKNMSKENRNLEQQLVFVENFVLFHKAGSKLLDLYKRITPDSMEGLNRIGNIQSYNDKAKDFDTSKEYETSSGEEVLFFGPDANGNVVDQFVGQSSRYGLERGYETLKDKSLRVASHFFPMRTSSAFLSMKERIKRGAGKGKLTSAMHQMIDGNLMFLMLTKQGSPFLNNYLGEEYATTLYKDPKANIGTNLLFFKKKYPKLASTKFISNFELESDTVKGYYGVKFDGSFNYTRAEREEFTSTLRGMLFSPHLFLNVNPEDVVIKDDVIQDPKLRAEAQKIKMFGTQLAMHSFLSSGFRQSAASYHDIIPIEFWSEPLRIKKGAPEKKSVLEFLHDEQDKLANPNYFDAVDLMTYMQLFGPMKAEGLPILERKSSKILRKETVELKSNTNKPFLVFRNSRNNEIGTFVNIGKSGKDYIYARLDSAFVGKTIYSIPNLESDEKVAKVNIIKDALEQINDIKVSGTNDNLLLCNG